MTGRRLVLAAALTLGACAAPVAEAPPTSLIRVLPGDGCAPLDWPVAAEVSSPFGPREGRAHTGIDLPVPEGTPVRAACGGVVRVAEERPRGYGRLVVVEHAPGLSTLYAHNRALRVRPGDVVLRGQVIAESGQTGRATGPHVHFEVRRDGAPVDPLGLLAPGPRDARMGYAVSSATTEGSSP